MSSQLEIVKMLTEELSRFFIREVTLTERPMKDDGDEHPTMLAYHVPIEEHCELIVIHDSDGNVIDPDKDSEAVMFNRLYIFLDSIDVPNTIENRLLLITLHEFGHFDFLDTMYEYGFGGQFKYISKTVEEYPTKAWTLGEYKKARADGFNIPYMLRGDEMYCDGFAMKHFMPVYKILKAKKLI